MYRITATAPTSYQLNSLRAFGMEVTNCGNGSFFSTKDFDNEQEAKAFLFERAHRYNDVDTEGSELRIASMQADIEQFGLLTLDAVTAHLNEIEETIEN